MHERPPQLETGDYSAVDNLEVMSVAVNYRRFLARTVADVAGEGVRTALDFGAGTGTHARDLAAQGFSVTCVELDDDLAGRLRKSGFETVRDIAELAGRRFEAVYTFNVLEHIEDDEASLRDIYEAVEPGGRAIVYVPALPALFSSMDRKVGHLRRYRRSELVGRVERAGFRVVEATYVDSLGVLATLLYKVVGNDRGDISERSVGFYDRVAFPLSRVIDRLTGGLFGKNLLVIGERPTAP